MDTLRAAVVSLLIATACGPPEQMSPPTHLRERDAPPAPASIADDEACELFTWPLPPDRAMEILKRTAMFTSTGVYFAGEPPPQIAAFNVLLDQKDSLPRFESIAQTGHTAGRLFALCAFQILAPDRASRLIAELKAEEGEVFTQFGCISGTEAVRDVAANIWKESTGRHFREAKDRTYAYYEENGSLCDPIR